MKGVLTRLQGLRELEKKKAWLDKVEAERQRDEQQQRLDAMAAEVHAIRQETDEEEAHWAAQRQSWCLQMEMRRRREEETLSTYAATHQECLERLEDARRRARIVELVLERIESDELAEERRQETRNNDEIGSMSWWRECG